ncbi:Rab18 GTPase, putative [Perkinsus marinus ATCC 50983]|uniref:Rab18 GTPase, putative n=1 Tax=Perkinsus marinus (strain ATCC 50983 / TXsc) TaxID=423536 RepID=C5LGH1_PERM5|nr:Rab18 GTPase, putative [Perkinsus marinus ATCC 50983]EER04157.1 Rab18 GTPase, putative [Perkinsus marinus ATCC 50983]|eukprot:XP_002772341.1 Rab18 GTPase, putative [Perkinsus marinus ATCC 50983]
MDPPNYDHLFKLLIIGDSGVGKSCLLLRFCDDEFNDKQLATIGVDFKVKYLSLMGKRLKLAIWDTAGQERFRTLTSSYYRGAQGIVLVYDVTSRESFENLEYWLEEVRKYATSRSSVKMLVANKVDEVNGGDVTRREGEKFAIEHDMLFIESSAKLKVGVKEIFQQLVLKILDTPDLLQNTTPLGATRERYLS